MGTAKRINQREKTRKNLVGKQRKSWREGERENAEEKPKEAWRRQIKPKEAGGISQPVELVSQSPVEERLKFCRWELYLYRALIRRRVQKNYEEKVGRFRRFKVGDKWTGREGSRSVMECVLLKGADIQWI